MNAATPRTIIENFKPGQSVAVALQSTSIWRPEELKACTVERLSLYADILYLRNSRGRAFHIAVNGDRLETEIFGTYHEIKSVSSN